MLNNYIKSEFTIKDLENFSGIKAHTIRIWEKRYNLLEPNRTDTNIRYYDIQNFKKLLNVTFLYNKGEKISKIAKLTTKEINSKINEYLIKNQADEQSVNLLKLAMLSFDERLFNNVYDSLLSNYPFRKVYKEILFPYLEKISYLWQTNSITPAHEHFVSSILFQKLCAQIERVKKSIVPSNNTTYVLYLPMNEIHELGLMYLYYELLMQGNKVVYLGQSVPLDNLNSIIKSHKNICFVAYFTVEPTNVAIETYFDEIFTNVLEPSNTKLFALGRKARIAKVAPQHQNHITIFSDLIDVLESSLINV